MRQLILMRGAIGSGKSTWIHEHKLDDFTISSDKVRVLLGVMAKHDLNGNLITVGHEREVFQTIQRMVESRMNMGQLTVVDAQHILSSDINAYRDLATKYNYSVYVVNMDTNDRDVLIARVHERNNKTGDLSNNKFIPDNAVIEASEKMMTAQVPRWCWSVSEAEAEEILPIKPISLDDYNGVIALGDIHSSYKVLEKSWEKMDLDNKLTNNWLVVILGDLFDRGTRPVETFQFIKERINNENLVVLMGNHDFNLFNETSNTLRGTMSHTHVDTTMKLNQAGISNKEIRGFLRKFNDGLFIYSNDKSIMLTHGGTLDVDRKDDKFALNKITSIDMIYGSGDFAEPIDKIASQQDRTITIHGHRNMDYKDSIITNNGQSASVNLEQGVDEGKSLAYLTLYPTLNMEVSTFENNEFNIKKAVRKQMVESAEEKSMQITEVFLDSARNSDSLKVKELGDDIVSVNFTRQAFFAGNWNKLTVKARGLFIDTNNYSVLARGYNKFFRIGEYDDWNDVSQHLPLKMYKKYNGFLALLTYNEARGKFIITSKSQIAGETSPYADRANDIIMSMINQYNIDDMRTKLTGKTALFEVVDESYDPHLVHNFDYPRAILLDILENNLSDDFIKNRLDYDTLVQYATDWKIPVKEHLGDITTNDNLRAKVQSVLEDKELEGIVLEGLDGYQVKCKTYLYTSAKYARGLYNRAQKANMTGVQFLAQNNKVPYDNKSYAGRNRLTEDAYLGLLKAIAKELDKPKEERIKEILEIRKVNNLFI